MLNNTTFFFSSLGEDDIIADPEVCLTEVGPKPGDRELCTVRKECPENCPPKESKVTKLNYGFNVTKI